MEEFKEILEQMEKENAEESTLSTADQSLQVGQATEQEQEQASSSPSTQQAETETEDMQQVPAVQESTQATTLDTQKIEETLLLVVQKQDTYLKQLEVLSSIQLAFLLTFFFFLGVYIIKAVFRKL